MALCQTVATGEACPTGATPSHAGALAFAETALLCPDIPALRRAMRRHPTEAANFLEAAATVLSAADAGLVTGEPEPPDRSTVVHDLAELTRWFVLQLREQHPEQWD